MQVTSPFYSMILRYSLIRGIEYVKVIYFPVLLISSQGTAHRERTNDTSF